MAALETPSICLAVVRLDFHDSNGSSRYYLMLGFPKNKRYLAACVCGRQTDGFAEAEGCCLIAEEATLAGFR